jgi:hypothetical protein
VECTQKKRRLDDFQPPNRLKNRLFIAVVVIAVADPSWLNQPSADLSTGRSRAFDIASSKA